MEYLIGVLLGAAVCAFGVVAGFDRERVFYPMLLMVIATYYLLFAVMAKSPRALTVECVVAGAFLIVAATGFRMNLWLVVAALGAHGVFDVIHERVIQNPGVPLWWPGFCLAFDIAAALFLAVLLVRRTGFASRISDGGRV